MTDFTPNTKKTIDLKQFESQDGIKFALDRSGEVFYLGWDALAQVCSIGLAEPILASQIKGTIEFYLSIKDTTVETPFESDVETPSGLQNVTLIPFKLGTQVIKQYNSTLYEEMAGIGHLAYLNQLPREVGIQAIKQYYPELYEEIADAGHLVYLNQLLGRSYL